MAEGVMPEPHFFGDGCAAPHGHIDVKTCDYCGEEVDPLALYQQYVGKFWCGHEDHVKEEAARWVLVQKADIKHVVARTENNNVIGLGTWMRLRAAIDQEAE